ncbi:MAG: hypothetical protein NT105_03825 [Verrucomicrobia bacterium]|nr:hypothetical protein [Verrucomicrobiota bacterium]
MNILCRPLVPLLLLALTVLDAAAQSDKEAGVTVWKTKEHFRPPNRITGHSEWKPVTIKIHSTMQAAVVRVEGKKSLWGLEVAWPLAVKGIFAPSTPKDPVVGFITPRGNIWVGREKHFYIESSAGVVGADYKNGIVWFESMVARKGQDKTTLDDCLKLFEREIDGDTLALFGSDIEMAADGTRTLCPLTHFTGLIPPLDPEILREPMPLEPTSPPGDVHLNGIQVTGNTLRLDLKSRRDGLFQLNEAVLNPNKLQNFSPKGWRGQYVASVWIDIPTRKVINAKENARSTWP